MSRSQEDIKMELTLALIEAGLTDSEAINHAVNSVYLNVIQKTFPENLAKKAQSNKVTISADMGAAHKGDVETALGVIGLFNFDKVEDLVCQLRLTAYGEVKTTGSLSK